MIIKTLPLSTNALYRGRRFLTNAGRLNKEAIAWEVSAEFRGKPHTGPVALTVALFFPDNRRRDIDNIKGLLDSFTGILYEDDSQIEKLTLSKTIDRERPRVEVQISSLQ